MKTNMRGRRRPALIASILAALLLAGAAISSATLIRHLNLREITDRAQIAFVGTVKEVDCRWSLNGKTLLTFVTFGDLEILKGEYADEILVLRLEGGSMPGIEIRAVGMPRFSEGERDVVFVRDNNRAGCPVVGWSQGKFILRQHLGDPNVYVKMADGIYLERIDGDRIVPRAKTPPPRKRNEPFRALTLEELKAAVDRYIRESGQLFQEIYSFTEKILDTSRPIKTKPGDTGNTDERGADR